MSWTATVAPSPTPPPPIAPPPAYAQPAYAQPAYAQAAYAQPAYGQPAYAPQPSYLSAYRAATPETWSPLELILPAERTMGTRALVWGIISIPLFVVPVWILAISYAVLGLVRARRLRSEGGSPVGRGRSIAGLILGCVAAVMTLVVYAFLLSYPR